MKPFLVKICDCGLIFMMGYLVKITGELTCVIRMPFFMSYGAMKIDKGW